MDSWSKTRIAAGTATSLISSTKGCTLGKVIINTKGAAANTLTIYDDVTAVAANIVAIIDTTVGPSFLEFNCYMNNGITAVSATGTGADYTITFR